MWFYFIRVSGQRRRTLPVTGKKSKRETESFIIRNLSVIPGEPRNTVLAIGNAGQS
jgi:hypothetical protein